MTTPFEPIELDPLANGRRRDDAGTRPSRSDSCWTRPRVLAARSPWSHAGMAVWRGPERSGPMILPGFPGATPGLPVGHTLDVAADVTVTVASYVGPAATAVKATVTLADTSVAYSDGEADEAGLAIAWVDAVGSAKGVGGATKLASGGLGGLGARGNGLAGERE